MTQIPRERDSPPPSSLFIGVHIRGLKMSPISWLFWPWCPLESNRKGEKSKAKLKSPKSWLEYSCFSLKPTKMGFSPPKKNRRREVFRKARQAAPCVIFFDEARYRLPRKEGKRGTAGWVWAKMRPPGNSRFFSHCFHLPGSHFGYLFLTHN